MKISEQFAGSYLKAQDLPQPRVMTITGCHQATMPDGTSKPALSFQNEQQQLIMNKTNAFCLAEWFGDDTTAWTGRQIELYATTTSFSGRMVPAIRVRLPQQPMQYQQPVQQVPAPQPVQQQSVPQPQQTYPAPQQQVPAPQPQQYQAAPDCWDGPVDA